MKRIFSLIIIVMFLISMLVAPGVQAKDEVSPQVLGVPFTVDSASGGYQIPKGSTINNLGNGDIVVTGPNGDTIFKTNDSLTEMVSTPDGWVKASHVYHVPSDSSVITEKNTIKVFFKDELLLQIIDKEISDVSSRAVKAVSPWMEYAEAYIGNLDFYTGVWTVPSSPPAPGSSAYDYLFNAIQIPNCILQPVLEWNYGGSRSWTIAAWYGIYGYYVRATNPKTASPGNVIRGTMAWDTNRWYISIINNSTGQYSNLYCYNLLVTSGMSAYCTLEGGNITKNGDVPGDTTFSSLSLRYNTNPITPSWAAKYNIPPGVTGMFVQIISSSSIKLNTAN